MAGFLRKMDKENYFDEAIVLLENLIQRHFDYANKDGLKKYGVPLKRIHVELYENAPIFIRGAILVTINKILEQRGHVVPLRRSRHERTGTDCICEPKRGSRQDHAHYSDSWTGFG